VHVHDACGEVPEILLEHKSLKMLSYEGMAERKSAIYDATRVHTIPYHDTKHLILQCYMWHIAAYHSTRDYGEPVL